MNIYCFQQKRQMIIYDEKKHVNRQENKEKKVP